MSPVVGGSEESRSPKTSFGIGSGQRFRAQGTDKLKMTCRVKKVANGNLPTTTVKTVAHDDSKDVGYWTRERS